MTLFPALGFFDSQFLIRWQVSDHLQYLPLIAPVAAAAAVLAAALPAMVFRGATAVLILVLTVLSFQRAEAFATPERTLPRHAGEESGGLGRAQRSGRHPGGADELCRGHRAIPRRPSIQPGLRGRPCQSGAGSGVAGEIRASRSGIPGGPEAQSPGRAGAPELRRRFESGKKTAGGRPPLAGRLVAQAGPGDAAGTGRAVLPGGRPG